MKYAFIQDHKHEHSVLKLCKALDVSPGGFYGWRDRPESKRQTDNRRLINKIRCYHKASREVYGSPRIHEDLIESGESVGVHRVARLMRSEGIASKVAKKFVITTQSRSNAANAPDRVKRCFTVTKPNYAWVCDTTFVPTRQGWLYLAVVIDLYSRFVVGWAMSNRNNTDLVKDALTMAQWRRKDVTKVIVHSDRGSTYTAADYRELLANVGHQRSLGRKGDCYDNAVAESFFGTLKNELVYHEDCRTRVEARQSLFEYIEVFYNRQRRHSHLDYLSPVEFERRGASQLNRP